MENTNNIFKISEDGKILLGIKNKTKSPRKIKIPKACFTNCSNLSEVILPQDVGIIDNLAFAGCKSLSQIKLGKSTIYG